MPPISLEILVHKAKTALERYSHNLVIGNLLSTRKWEVVFVAPGRPDKWIRIPSVATASAAATGNNNDKAKTGHKRTLSEMEEKKRSSSSSSSKGVGDDDGDGGGGAVVAVAAEDRPLDPETLPEGDPDVEIESLIIPALEEFHSAHIREARSKRVENGNV